MKKIDKYVLDNIEKKSIEILAKELNIKPRNINKILEKYNVKKTKRLKLKLAGVPLVDTYYKTPRFMSMCLIAILVIAAAVRLGYLNQLQSNPLPFFASQWESFDQYRFMELVNKFVGGNWLGTEVTRYSPAYSYIIAVLFKIFVNNINIIFVFQSFMGILAVYVMYRAVSLLFSNKKIGLIAAFITALYSPLVFYEGAILRASLIAYFNLIGFYFFLKAIKKPGYKYFFIAGIIIGISMVLRPNVIPILVIPYLLATKRFKAFKYKIAAVLLFILGASFVILPLNVRNRALGRDVLISYQGPSSFWIGNTYDSTGIGVPRRGLRNKLAAEGKGSLTETCRILYREITKHPVAYKNLYLLKLKMFLNGYEIPANFSYDLFKKNHSMLKMSFFNFSIICPLALLGIFLAYNKYRYINIVYLLLFALSFSVVVFHIQGRYRIPSVPFFIVLSSFTIYWFIYMMREKRFIALSCALSALAIISLYTKPAHNIILKHFKSYVRNTDYENLARCYIQKSEETTISKSEKKQLLEKAAQNLNAAANVSDLFYKIEYLLWSGSIYYKTAKYNEASSIYKEVLLLDPNNKTAAKYINLIER